MKTERILVHDLSSLLEVVEQHGGKGTTLSNIPDNVKGEAVFICRWECENGKIIDFIAASPDTLYTTDRVGNVVLLSREDGSILGALPLRHFSIRVPNDRTDRIFMTTPTGMVRPGGLAGPGTTGGSRRGGFGPCRASPCGRRW